MHPREWIMENQGKRYQRAHGGTVYLARALRWRVLPDRYTHVGRSIPFIDMEREHDGRIIPVAYSIVARFVQLPDRAAQADHPVGEHHAI